MRRTVFNRTVNAPKTARSNRSVRLANEAIRVLRDQQNGGGEEWVLRVGTSLSTHNVTNRSRKPLQRKAGLPQGTRFHDLRHTCATLLLTKGVHPKIVQEMLGHSSITITLDLYCPQPPPCTFRNARIERPSRSIQLSCVRGRRREESVQKSFP